MGLCYRNYIWAEAFIDGTNLRGSSLWPIVFQLCFFVLAVTHALSFQLGMRVHAQFLSFFVLM